MSNTGTCAMCQQPNVTLIDSHVLPNWVYRRRHRMNPGNQLIATGNGKVGYTSKQDSAYLLCRPCEDLLGRREQYVSGVVVQPDRTFPALAHVGPATPVVPGVDLVTAGALDVDQLTYFAVSVFWRADVAQSDPLVSLGEYREPIREYLTGSALPAGVYLQVVLLDPPRGDFVARVAAAPESHPGGFLHDLVVLGLHFRLFTTQDPGVVKAAEAFSLPHTKSLIVDRRRNASDMVAEEAQTSTAYGKLAEKT